MGEAVLLVEPACDVGCSPCSRACAVKQIHLNWWLTEEERLLRVRPNSVSDRWPPWQVEWEEASETVQRLQQEIVRVCPANLAVYPQVLRGSRPQAHLQ